jgi:hypothetical protein
MPRICRYHMSRCALTGDLSMSVPKHMCHTLLYIAAFLRRATIQAFAKISVGRVILKKTRQQTTKMLDAQEGPSMTAH